MSATEWMAKHYPITAQEAAKGTWLEAAKHSLVKWEGARKETLVQFGLREPPIVFNADSCSLCEKDAGDCIRCPLFKVRGDVRCTEQMQDEKFSPYESPHRIISTHKLMIKWLRKTVEYCEKEGI